MFIHKSHSKKDLNNIIETFKINIDNPRQYKKKELLRLLTKELDVLEEIEPETKYYMFYNIIELKDYLSKCNPKKLLSIKEKNEVIFKCKAIQQYVNNNYCLEKSTFNSVEDIKNTANNIRRFGDIPSVRRACKGLNNHPNKIYDVVPIISKQTRAELDRRAELKKKYPMKLQYKKGNFLITFD